MIQKVAPLLLIYVVYLGFGWFALPPIILLLIFWYAAGAHNSGRYPPQTSKFFFGDLLTFRDNYKRMPSWMVDLQEKYGHKTLEFALPTFPGIDGFSTLIAIFTPENLQYILKDNFSNYVKGPISKGVMKELFGNGIFVADGELWKLKRKMASNMFSRNLLRASTDVAYDQALKLVHNIEAKVDTGEVFDLQSLFFAFTIDTFVSIAFGVELHSLEREGMHPFAKAFDTVQSLCEKRLANPIWRFTEYFSAAGRDIPRGCQVINEFAEKIINAKRRDFAASNTRSKTKNLGADLITLFLSKCDADATVEELRDMVMNFIIAGRDTTACALSWQHLELLRHPPVYEKVVREATTDIGEGDALEKMSQKDRFEKFKKRLPYLQAVTRETLRLHPSVPKMLKFAVNDDKLPDGTIVPRGAAVLWSQYAMGHSHQIWPDRAKKYDPNRWLAPEDANGFRELLPDNMPTSRYPTFHMMPRLCLGKPLALLEIHMVTAMLARRFEFSPAPGGLNDEYASTIVLPMKHGLKVTAKRRHI